MWTASVGRRRDTPGGEVVSEAGMTHVVPSGATSEPVRAHRRRRLTLLAGAAALVVVSGISACTSKNGSVDKTSPAANTSVPRSSTSAAPAPDAVITTTPLAGTKALSPIKPVTVSVADGKLTSVTMVNPDGKEVRGHLSLDRSGWRSTEDLGYSKTYRLTAVAQNADGKSTTKKTTFTTLTPGNMTMPYLQRPGAYTLDNGSTYGVGIVPVVHFDEAITNKRAAEKALVVTTTPQVRGSWSWVSNQDVHWRPREYFKPGTKVTVRAKVYGVEVGQGLFGQADKQVSFTIGPKHLAIANAQTHQVKVYFSGKLMRTMPTSMGQGGYVEGRNGPIALWTPPGIYTVIAHENPASMSSDSYGLSPNSPKGYPAEDVYWATKISVDGIYLHELDTTVWAQGHSNVSHGCLNLNLENARWYYQHALVGDLVQVVQSGGPKLEQWQNGDWSVPWATWVKGSALH
jgi:lipoprotein-anchoring transpeptidase ErfK/SrfK